MVAAVKDSKYKKSKSFKKPVYILPDTSPLFIRQDAQKDLGIISKHYPNPEPDMEQLNKLDKKQEQLSEYAPCGCLTRRDPPPPLIIPKNPENQVKLLPAEERNKMKEALLWYYAV